MIKKSQKITIINIIGKVILESVKKIKNLQQMKKATVFSATKAKTNKETLLIFDNNLIYHDRN